MQIQTEILGDLLFTYGMKLLAALAIVLIGRWIAKIIAALLRRILTKRQVDTTLVNFSSQMVYAALLAFVLIAAIGQLGVQTASFVAVVGAAGLAVGLALQGSLANFAAGVLLILFRPFKAGDYIEGGGMAGTVEKIGIFVTELKTPDNRQVIIPNARISSDNIVNYSTEPQRRVDMVFGVSYEDKLDEVRRVIAATLAADKRILKNPEPMIVVQELADNSVNFAVRPWVKNADYWGVYFDTHEALKKAFDDAGITIPFPQRVVHQAQDK